MISMPLTGWLRAGALVATTALVAATGPAAYAQSTTHTNIPIVGCHGSVIPLDADAEMDDDEKDEADANAGESDQGPAIVGTIRTPRGMGEDDKRLATLAIITAAQAREAAMAAISDASERRIKSTSVESQQGYVVYAVKTVRTRPGDDPKLEVKVDAGNGAVLMIECDPNDN